MSKYTRNQYISLGPDAYPDLIEKDKGMTYVSDTYYNYWNPSDHSGESDYTTCRVNFIVNINNIPTAITAFRSQGRYCSDKIDGIWYNGFQITPAIRYVNNNWYLKDEKTLTDAIQNKNIDLVKGLLEYSDDYSNNFLAQKIVELLENNKKRKKRKK